MAELYRITTAQSGPIEEEPRASSISVVQRREDTEAGEPLLGEIVDTATAANVFSEKRLNAIRMQRFRNKFSARFLQLLREQDFEYGLVSPADELVQKCLNENEFIAKQWLNELFLQNYADPVVVIGILRVLSHFEYHEVTPQGPTMALAALANSSAEVRECGIRVCENWNTLETLKILMTVQCTEKWLNDYLQQVIAALKEELGENVVVG